VSRIIGDSLTAGCSAMPPDRSEDRNPPDVFIAAASVIKDFHTVEVPGGSRSDIWKKRHSAAKGRAPVRAACDLQAAE